MKNNGQALIEFLVGLVVIIVLCAGLLQLTSLTNTHTDVMSEARREAGEAAMLDLGAGYAPVSDPDYIHSWEPGPDGVRHTRDDIFTTGNAPAFQNTIVDPLVENPADWDDIIDSIPRNGIKPLRDSFSPVSLFGLVKGHDSRTIPLLPAVRSLLYRADNIKIEADVWMTWTTGIY